MQVQLGMFKSEEILPYFKVGNFSISGLQGNDNVKIDNGYFNIAKSVKDRSEKHG